MKGHIILSFTFDSSQCHLTKTMSFILLAIKNAIKTEETMIKIFLGFINKTYHNGSLTFTVEVR